MTTIAKTVAALAAITLSAQAAAAAEWKGGVGPIPLDVNTTTVVSIYNTCATTARFVAKGVELQRGTVVINASGRIAAGKGHQIVVRTAPAQPMLLLDLTVVCDGSVMPAPRATARFIGAREVLSFSLNYEEIS